MRKNSKGTGMRLLAVLLAAMLCIMMLPAEAIA